MTNVGPCSQDGTRAPAGTGPAGATLAPPFFVTLALLLALVCSGCLGGERGIRRGSGPGLRPPPLSGRGPGGFWHVVAEGETLSTLAGRFQVPLQDLAEINDLPDPERLLAGRELFVPGREPGTSPPAASAARQRPSSGDDGATTLRQPRGLFDWPVGKEARLTSRFGHRWGREHEGIDLAAPSGTPVRAAAAGVVIYSGEARGYGNLVLIEHDVRYVTVYGHNQLLLVKEGQRVRRGQLIARVGSTGHSTGPHLHFEIRDRGKPRNPLFFYDTPGQ